MKDLKDATICVIDHGLFIPLALRLAEKANLVYYHSPCEAGFPMLAPFVIGDFPPLVRCNDFWRIKSEVDAFVFPDIGFIGEQLELESQGFPVWGSKAGAELEISRRKFLKTLQDLKMDCVEFESLVGVQKLREYLRGNDDKFIKISKYRGLMETWHHETYETSRPMLDRLAVKCGALQDDVPFLAVDPVETDIELGADTYCINGRWPSTMLQGYEWKDAGYLGAITQIEDMPEQATEVLDKFGPILAGSRYVNAFSMELRVLGKKSYFIDPCCRFPLPATGAQLEAYTNVPEIIYAGAHGELVEPDPQWKFVVECVIKTARSSKDEWSEAEIGKLVPEGVHLSSCCRLPGKGVVAFPPTEQAGEEVGWLSAGGDTIQEAINLLQGRVKLLPATLKCDTRALVDLLAEVRTAEKEGIEFTEQEVPKPAAALDV